MEGKERTYKFVKESIESKLYLKVLIFSIILVGIIITLDYLTIISFSIQGIMTGLATALLTTCFSVYLLKIPLDQESKEIQEKNIQKIIMSLMTGKNEENIIPWFDDRQINNIIKNCLIAKLPVFESSNINDFVTYIRTSLSSIRKNFNYKIEVKENSINQELSFTRIFNTENTDNNDPVKLQMYFAFSEKVLEDKLGDQAYFNREVLSDDDIINKIKNSYENKQLGKILELLKIQIQINDNKIYRYYDEECKKCNNISIQMDSYGLEISTVVPQQFLTYTENWDRHFCSYTGKVKFEYPYNGKHFYCMFTQTCIGKTEVSIKFNNMTDYNNFNLVTMLSLKDNDFITDGNQDTKTRTFETEATIIPRAGLTMHWH